MKSVFFDWPHKELGYKYMDDWYNVTQENIHKNGGRGPLDSWYANSPSKALTSIYPEHNWELEKSKNKPLQLRVSHESQRKAFSKSIQMKLQKIPLRFWKNKENHTIFFDWLHKELGHLSMDDWYNV